MKKILVIEDDRDIGDILEMILSVNYQVVIVKNASNIVEIYTRFLPELLIIDNFVVDREAADIIAELRREGGNTLPPFILFSGAPDVSRRAVEMGASAYLAKPFDIAELNLVVESVLRDYTGREASGGYVKLNDS